MLRYDKCLNRNARRLRSEMTDAELRLWSRLRGKQVHGMQFYRQKPVAAYIVDFYCAAADLVIEVDGGQHFEAEGRESDRVRDADLARLGLFVLRFDNRQVLAETDAVVDEIARIVVMRLKKSPPARLLQRRELTANIGAEHLATTEELGHV